jgi:uncharacterized protein (DUF488 family)
MDVFTIGFTQTTAEHFFGRLADAGVVRVLDIRLRNDSQLAGFAKARDLPYFLRELIGADYEHEPRLAPTAEIMDAFKKQKGRWEDFAPAFKGLLAERAVEDAIDRGDFDRPTALLCSEADAAHCHRRLVVEYLDEKWGGMTAVDL